MTDETPIEGGIPAAMQGSLDMDSPGATLRRAREAKGMSLAEVAASTRVAQRQLEAIEADDFSALPGIPYAIGFARAYARAVGADEVAIAAKVRQAVHASDMGANRYEMFEPADPARVPTRLLAWTAAIVALIVAAGFGIWRTQMFTAPTAQEAAQDIGVEPNAPAQRTAASAPAPATAGPVVLTASQDVWLRIYDDAGERLKEGTMKAGDTFTIPANASNPMILTGRPQALAVTVGGVAVPPLGPPDRSISDVPVSAAALLARAAQAPAQATPPAVTPAPVRRTPAPSRPRTVAQEPSESTAPASTPAAAPTTPPATTPAPAPAAPEGGLASPGN
ncbi:cytoskeletal protein RodZ [Sphingobium fontiphilum]|uniref:Cytoskeletal protein RodZ n=1 Tax=Sphingobium fontiphilum TaxID=944425 RepID=A0A7W6GMX1_9SPHN|nr:helix-turn-helix domain-containing protein [Sphingobium fontiphilum]MBB3981691.1 cytoskeletal protein RodZ [Sphingobium fontiphilum]